MKKMSIILTLLVVMFVSMSVCFADTSTKEMDIYAKYQDKTEGIYKDEIDNGNASITLPNEIEVSVDIKNGNYKKIAIIPVFKEDKEAYEWFENVTKEYGDNILPLDIFFLNQNNEKEELARDDVFTIAITVPKEMKNPTICYVANDGTVQVIKSEIKGNKIIFSTTHNSYYVVVDKTKLPTTSSVTSDTPATGGKSNTLTILAFLLLTMCAVVTLVGKKKNTRI